MKSLGIALFAIAGLAACGEDGLFAMDNIEIGVNGNIYIFAGADDHCGVSVSSDERPGPNVPFSYRSHKYELIGRAVDPGYDFMRKAIDEAVIRAKWEDYDGLQMLARKVISAACK